MVAADSPTPASPAVSPRPITERERDILRELRFFHRHPEQAPHRDGFCRCMDVGGTDASYHSGVLRRMVKRGWVERRYGYRITDQGLAVLENSNAR